MLMRLFGTIPLPDDHAEKTDVAAAIEELQSPCRADLEQDQSRKRLSLLSALLSQDMYIHVATKFSDKIVVNQVNMMYDVAAISWLRQKIACIDRCEVSAVKESRKPRRLLPIDSLVFEIES
jgi:hypothetical protein